MRSIFTIGAALIMFVSSISTVNAQSQRKGNVTKVRISTNAVPILGGELSNSAVSCLADIDSVIPKMVQYGLNTVLVPVYWDLMEPKEGQFDFALVDRTIHQARQNQLKVVFLWFGVWKNSMSCYAPLWFKQDVKRFPRACTADGKPLEIACCFSESVLQADNRAFDAFVRHVVERGSDVVSMIQVENEIGMLEAARDHSRLADDVYHKGVPKELLTYLRQNQKSLHPWLASRIQVSQLSSRNPSWQELFGNDIFADEIFMAYYYARYVGRLCRTARQYTQMPLYVNAAMNSRGRLPGQYPSAGPLAHLIDLWRAGAPELLLLAPDIYDTGFKGWAEQYALPGNPLFIPETRCCQNSGVRALYAFGEHHAIGFSPFAIDQSSHQDVENLTKAYNLIRQIYYLKPDSDRNGVHATANDVMVASRFTLPSSLKTWGVLFDRQDKERIINDGSNVLTCRHYFTLPWDSRATDGSEWPEGGAVIVKLSKDEYLLAGSGVVVSFATAYEKAYAEETVLGEDGFVANGVAAPASAQPSRPFQGKRLGIGFVDEVNIDDKGHIRYVRRENGDQDHQGRHARIACGAWKILHVKLYEYGPQ